MSTMDMTGDGLGQRATARVVLISGGEPLLNPQWPEIAALLKAQGLKLWLLTSGLSPSPSLISPNNPSRCCTPSSRLKPPPAPVS